MGLFDSHYKNDKVTFRRLVLEGRAQLGPELATDCERAYWEKVYWAERTWGMSNDELEVYLEPRRGQILEPYYGGTDTLH